MSILPFRTDSFAALSVSSGPSPADFQPIMLQRYAFFLCTDAEKRERSLVLNIIGKFVIAGRKYRYSGNNTDYI